MKASLCLQAAERPQWQRLYSSGRTRSCDRMPSLVSDRGPVLQVLSWALGPIATSYSFVASLFETVWPRTSILAGSSRVFPLSRTVVIRAGNRSEHRSEQLFRQRPSASDNINQMVQVGRLILPWFYVYLE